MDDHLMIVLLGLIPLAVAILLVWVANLLCGFAFCCNTAAYGLRRAGFTLAMLIAMAAAVSGPSQGLLKDIQAVAFDGALAFVMLAVAWGINEFMILPHLNNNAALVQNNRAVGIIEFASLVATGIIVYGSLTGTGGWLTAVVFFFLGQAALIVAFWVTTWFTDEDDLKEIENDNLSVAGDLGGTLVALGIVLGASAAGDFTSWRSDLTAFAIDAGIGAGSMWILGLVAKRVFASVLAKSSAGAVYTAVALKVGAAIMIATAII